MRKWIDLIEGALNEQIVHKDQFVRDYCQKKTVVAINPSRAEWKANFPKGAAGILTTDGKIVVGDGDCLDHSSILDYAGISYSLELCRLQIHATAGLLAEIWIPDELDGQDRETVLQGMEADLGMSFIDLEARLKAAVRPFMGDVPAYAVLMSIEGHPMFPEDEAASDSLWNA